MSRRKKIAYGFFITFGIFLLGASFYIARIKGVDASEIIQRGEIIWQTTKSMDIDEDGKEEKLYLTIYENNKQKRAFLSIYENIFSKKEIALSGFEEDLAFCPQMDFINYRVPAVCVFGEVGVHSENIQIINLKKLTPVSFINDAGSTLNNIASDSPNFDIETDNDRIILYVDNRNYDQDPLIDIFRVKYYFDGKDFKYFETETIKQEGYII